MTKWPQLDMSLFVRRVTGIDPDDEGRFSPNEPWGNFVGRQQLVANTMIRILSRDGQPCSIQYLTEEINRLVGHLLPDRYNTLNAIRNVTSTSDEISWQGLATFGLKEWDTNIGAKNTGRRGRTGDLIYAFPVQHGPTDIDDVIRHVQQTTKAKKRTVADAINNDPENRFIRVEDRRIAANPIPRDHNPDGLALTVIPDTRQEGPVLRESELMWLTRYVQVLNDLAPPLPQRIALTGFRASGFALGDSLKITVVASPSDAEILEPRLAEIAAATSEIVPAVRPSISILLPEQWDRQQAGETAPAHHNVWLAPRTSP